MDEYFKRFGGVRDYLANVVEVARKLGYTETIYGTKKIFSRFNKSRPPKKRNG